MYIQAGIIIMLLMAGGWLLIRRPSSKGTNRQVRWTGAAVLAMAIGFIVVAFMQVNAELAHSIGH
ncbi:hypothetical protein [Paenibacillus sp. GCM10027626]|uniref:hypothetical protein n=1 Tax=Paenibacillus sp. GCM10027626 TaxID=3273411 RepID=UPI003629F610